MTSVLTVFSVYKITATCLDRHVYIFIAKNIVAVELSMGVLWEELKSYIKGQLPEKSYSLWINPLSLIDEKEDTLVLGCPNKFSMNWIIDHYGSLLERSLRNMGKDHNIIYKVSNQVRKRKASREKV